jgi:hypothetical protein
MIRSTSIFLEHWVFPNINTFFDPILYNRNKCVRLLPTFLVHIHGSWTFNKPYKIRLKCYMKHFGKTTRELGEPFKEGDGNTLRTRKKAKNPSLRSMSCFNYALTNKLVSTHLEHSWCWDKPRATQTHLIHHGLDSAEATTFPHIEFSTLHYRTHTQMAFLSKKESRNCPRTLWAHNFSLRPYIGMRSQANL